jgi:protease II
MRLVPIKHEPRHVLAQRGTHFEAIRHTTTTRTNSHRRYGRVDDYFWVRDKAEPTVIEYLKAEDAYANAVMKPRAAFQDALYKEMVGHIKETDTTVRYRRGDYFLLLANDRRTAVSGVLPETR